ncbi:MULTISPECIES: STAS domain-containing protein [Streptacidiphilus]|uniref:STAS domain-containing protein n=1 Tax=Streptacidiphilus cavernicola TaxID=3342716 RepID=A0ABV6UW14_9ACTN|nr:STAS domain-containing protein [Streptacidiphilus jeojiense]
MEATPYGTEPFGQQPDFWVSSDVLPDGQLVCRVFGDLDADTVRTAEDAITTSLLESPRLLVIDFAHCSFFDSSGLGMLIRLRNRPTETIDMTIRLSGLPLTMSRIFSFTGADSIFTTWPTVADALASGTAPD